MAQDRYDFPITDRDGSQLPLTEALRQVVAGDQGEIPRMIRLVLGRHGYKRSDKVVDDPRDDPFTLSYYQHQMQKVLLGGAKSPDARKNVKQFVDALKVAAKAHGVDPEMVATGNPAEVLAQYKTLLEATDEELDALERHIPSLPPHDEAVKKKLRSSTERTRSLRNDCRGSLPRFAMYVFRSQISLGQLAKTRLPDDTKRFGLLYIGDTQLRIMATMLFRDKWVVQIHPGAGKSQLAQIVDSFRLCRNPSLRMAYVTHAEDDAGQRIRYLTQVFSDDNPMGRRRRSLFPDAKLDSGRHVPQSALRFQLKRDVSSVQVSMEGASYDGKAEGQRRDHMTFDDPVDAHDGYEISTRERHVARWGTTWERRLDSGGSWGVIGQPWANGDLMTTLEKRPDVYVRRMPVGPNFEPVVPEVANAGELRVVYADGPREFSQLYWLKPASDSDRIIHALHFYDPDSEEGRIVEAAKCPDGFGRTTYISVDPGGTGKKAKDVCAVIRAVLYRNKLYVHWGRGFHNKPSIVQQQLAEVALDPANDMDAMVAEIVGNLSYLLEFLENHPAIGKAGKFHAAHPGSASKGERLRNTASPIDTGRVLFRGRWIGEGETRELRADPAVLEICDQLLQFIMDGASKDDFVDSVTQIVGRVRMELHPPAIVDDPEAGMTAHQVAELAHIRRVMGDDKPSDEAELARFLPMWRGDTIRRRIA